MNSKTKIKIFSKFLLLVFCLNIFFIPFLAKAQLAVWDAGVNATLVGMGSELAIISKSIGIPGVEQGIMAGVNASVDAACKGISKAEDVAATADTVGNFSLIGGSPAESAKLTAKIAALQTVKTCREAQLEVYKKVPVTSLIIGQELVRKQNDLSTEINELGVRIENLSQRQSASFKDVLKAVSVKLLLTFSQKLTTRLVNMLIAKYRIGNYLKYADAVATQIYEKQYITQNYPDKENQLIIASLLNSDAYRGGVLPAIQMEASRNLGFIPNQLVVSDPNYWMKMAQAGSGQANPYFMQTIYESRADLAKATGRLHSQSELSQGTGFIPVRNCQGSVTQQAQIYKDYAALTYKTLDDREVLERLQAQYIANPNNPQARAEMEKAANKLGISEDALHSMPKALNSPIVPICSAITNPGAFMGKAISDLLKSQIDRTTVLQSDNLPFYGQFIVTVANGLISNILEGGHSNLKLLTDSGITAGNILSVDYLNGLQQPTDLQNGSAAAENGGAFIAFDDIDPTVPQPTGTYNLKWSAANYPDAVKADAIGISGVNPQPSASLTTSLTGSAPVTFNLPGTYDFQLRIFNSTSATVPSKVISVRIVIKQNSQLTTNGNPIGTSGTGTTVSVCSDSQYTDILDCRDKTGDPGYCTSICTGVLGASTSVVPLNVRGDMPVQASMFIR